MTYQRLFNLAGTANACFRVLRRADKKSETDVVTSRRSTSGCHRGALISDQVFAEPDRIEADEAERPDSAITRHEETQESPWLERRRWLQYHETHLLS